MPTLAEHIGTRIRQLRQEHKMLATELATYVGCDRSTIARIEAGLRFPSVELIERLAEVFAIDEMDLFTFPGAHARHRINDLTRRAPLPALHACESLLRQSLQEVAKKRGSR